MMDASTLEKTSQDTTPRNHPNSAAMTDASSLENGTASAHPIEKTAAEMTASVRDIHGAKWVLVIISILSSILLYALDNTIVANIIPPIVKDLKHVEQLAWIAVGFMIGGLCVAMPVGRLYGVWNAKWLYMISIILFMAGSALCGAAPTLSALIIGRVIAGAGGNGMYVGVVTLVSVNTSEKERPTYLGLIGLVYGAGTVLGPIIGGAFADSPATWRWGFYINLVFGGVFIPILFFLLPSFDPRPGMAIKPRLGLFDYAGAVLQAGFFVCGIMAINFGGTQYLWDSAPIIVLFVLFAVLFVTFALQQTFNWFTNADGRMFPVHMLKMKEPVLLFITMAANNAGAFVLMYYIPLYFQFTKGVGALDSGIKLLPLIVTVTAAIMLNGAMMSKTGYYFPWYIGGSILVLVGGVLLSRIDIHTSQAVVYGYQIILGIGVGSFLQAGYAVIQGVLDPIHLSYGVTFMLVGQLLGISLALSISGSMYVNITVNELQKILPDVSRAQLQGSISGTTGAFFDAMGEEMREAALEVIMSSMQKIFVLVYVAGAVCLVTSLFLSRQKLNLGPAAGG